MLNQAIIRTRFQFFLTPLVKNGIIQVFSYSMFDKINGKKTNECFWLSTPTIKIEQQNLSQNHRDEQSDHSTWT